MALAVFGIHTLIALMALPLVKTLKIEGDYFHIKGIGGNQNGHINMLTQIKLIKHFTKIGRSAPKYRLYLEFENKRTFTVIHMTSNVFPFFEDRSEDDFLALGNKLKRRLNLDFNVEERSMWKL